jgi:hypothetical protein
MSATSSFAQKSSSKTFKGIVNLYEKQVDVFFVDVFANEKTGAEIALTAKTEMDLEIYDAFISDYYLWAKWTKKHQGKKPFVLNLKGTKEYEAESKTYETQFKAIQTNFINERLNWTKEELKKVLTQERLQQYIDPVTEKFADRTKKLLTKIK